MLLTEEHNMIRKTVHDFAEREIRPLARELDEKGEFSIELTRKMGEIGLFGLRTAQEYGGLDMDTLAYVIAVEELAGLTVHRQLPLLHIFHWGSVRS